VIGLNSEITTELILCILDPDPLTAISELMKIEEIKCVIE
jgi:hypothetical protein